jgi:enoyl-CoA hydratase
MAETLELSIEGGIALLRLDRESRLNAINPAMVKDLAEALDRIEADESVRAVVLTGTGRAFCAGADISALDQLDSADRVLEFLEGIQRVLNRLEDLRRPTIAAMNGLAFGGGCEIAISCDLRILAEGAAIGVPEIKIGVLPGAGGTQRLARLLPPAVAKQMIYFGEPLSAEDALRHGLVNRVVPDGEVVSTAREWALRLTELPPLALRSAKLLVHGAGLHGLETGIQAERQAVAFLFSTEDRREGMRAFLEKRRPTFRGR